MLGTKKKKKKNKTACNLDPEELGLSLGFET